MEVTNQDRILALLKEESPLSSVEIAEKLQLGIKKVTGANVRLKKRGKIVSKGNNPAYYSLTGNAINEPLKGVQNKVLTLIKKEGPITSLQIVEKLGLKKRQVLDANVRLKRRGIIIGKGVRPVYYSFNNEYGGSLSDDILNENTEIEEAVEFSDYLILYLTCDSDTPKMLLNFSDKDSLLSKYGELSSSPDVINHGIYKRVEVIQKFEIKI